MSARRFGRSENSANAGMQKSSVGELKGHGAIRARSGGRHRGLEATLKSEHLRIKLPCRLNDSVSSSEKLNTPFDVGDKSISVVHMDELSGILPPSLMSSLMTSSISSAKCHNSSWKSFRSACCISNPIPPSVSLFLRCLGFTASYVQDSDLSAHRAHCGRPSSHFFFYVHMSKSIFCSREGYIKHNELGTSKRTFSLLCRCISLKFWHHASY